MSSHGNGSAAGASSDSLNGQQAGMAPQFQQLTPLGTKSGDWLTELKSLGYMPSSGSWGNIGQTVMVPQPQPQLMGLSDTSNVDGQQQAMPFKFLKNGQSS